MSESGWRKPQTPGTWREPEQEEKPVGWRLSALPEDLSEQPAQEGEWHLPSPEDTTFKPEDKIEIRPEDEMNLPATAEKVDVPPEDALAAPEDSLPAEQKPALVAPEDLMYMIEHLDEQEEEDDFNTVGFQELIALASLAETETSGNVVEGEASPISADLILNATDGDSEELNMAMLSPAERMMLQNQQTQILQGEVVEDTGEVDPAEYARQQMQALLGSSEPSLATEAEDEAIDPAAYARKQMQALMGDSPAAETPSQPGDTLAAAAGDPGAYARKQMESLLGDADVASDYTPLPQATEPLNPREQELARKFRATEEQVRQLRGLYQSGQLSEEAFVNQLRDLMILDDDQVWWMMGVETDTWYKSENNQWVEAVPPVLEKQGKIERGARTGAGSDEFGSLAYLPDDLEYTPPQTDGIELDENFMPLPRQVPMEDPEATVPNQSAFRMGAGQTVPSQSYTDQTVRATPIDYNNAGIASPIDETEPPDYDLVEDDAGDEYERAAKRQQNRLYRTIALVGVGITALTFLAGAGFVGMATLWYNNIADQWQEPIASLRESGTGIEFQTVTILDRNGNRIALLGREGDDRRPVPIEEVSPYFIHAILSLENERFYDDPGWDIFAIMRAFSQNITSGEVVSGASTITQQVARSLVIQNSDFANEAERKLNEIIIANELNEQFTKTEILQIYLNDVLFFGNQAYGIEAAAQLYFNKPASELNIAESALLAGIIQAPANYEPIGNRQIALDRMEDVLDRMAQIGCVQFEHVPASSNPSLTVNNDGTSSLCIDQATLNSGTTAVNKAIIQTTVFEPRQFNTDYPHFVQLVQNQLESAYGTSAIYREGFVVTTTLDSTIQDSAQNALVNRVDQLRIYNVDTGAVMVTDPRTGAILALVGSPDYNDSEVGGQEDKGRTYQQPGSAIKPIVYAMALEGLGTNYYTPVTIVWDVPTIFQNDGTQYQPVNYGNAINGPVTVRTALGSSLNIPAVKTFIQFGGVENFRNTAETMGIRFSTDAEFSLASALGATEVRLYDMMQAYGAIANDGTRFPLYTIDRIQDSNGNEIPIPESLRGASVPALNPSVAYLLQDILSDDSARAAGFPLNSTLTISGLPTTRTVAVKTGTTDNGRDLWTMGFTNNRVVGVWLGNNQDNPTLNNQTGFTAASPVWNEVMRVALTGENPGSFQPTGNIREPDVCFDRGDLFSQGEFCTIHRTTPVIDSKMPPENISFTETIGVDSWSGLRANQYCSNHIVQMDFASIDDQAAISWLNNTAQGQAYAQRVGIQLPLNMPVAGECDATTLPPNVVISSPGGGQSIQGGIQITGQASAPDGAFSRYEIQYAPAGTENWVTITTATTPQPNANSMLATWDTTSVPNGNYTLRIVMYANNTFGGSVSYRVDVTIVNILPTSTPQPTATPQPIIVPTDIPPIASPLPFDPIGNPTPTIDPTG